MHRWYLISPEAYRISSFMLFGLILFVCVILIKAFADVPENTDLKRAFGYNNACVYLDYPPAAQIAPTLWILSSSFRGRPTPCRGFCAAGHA